MSNLNKGLVYHDNYDHQWINKAMWSVLCFQKQLSTYKGKYEFPLLEWGKKCVELILNWLLIHWMLTNSGYTIYCTWLLHTIVKNIKYMHILKHIINIIIKPYWNLAISLAIRHNVIFYTKQNEECILDNSH